MNNQDYQWMYCHQCRSSHYFERKMHMWQCPNCHALRDVSSVSVSTRTANNAMNTDPKDRGAKLAVE
jgi:ribosomal protein L37AE/L43A